MLKDRFRPDAALRGIIPFSSAPATVILGQSGGQIAEVLVDKPDASRHFEDRGPIAGVGRNSIPRSHRGEGFNYVD